MSELIKKYKDWKANPADYGYDCIGEFITDLTESETVEFMEWVEKLSDERSNCNIPCVSPHFSLIEKGSDKGAFDWILKSERHACEPNDNSRMIRILADKYNQIAKFLN